MNSARACGIRPNFPVLTAPAASFEFVTAPSATVLALSALVAWLALVAVSAFVALSALVAWFAFVALSALVAWFAVVALGTVPSVDSLIALPVRLFGTTSTFLTSLPFFSCLEVMLFLGILTAAYVTPLR